jgi:hypothetical protein
MSCFDRPPFDDVGLDLLERAESEPLVESASAPVDMEDAKSERLSGPS